MIGVAGEFPGLGYRPGSTVCFPGHSSPGWWTRFTSAPLLTVTRPLRGSPSKDLRGPLGVLLVRSPRGPRGPLGAFGGPSEPSGVPPCSLRVYLRVAPQSLRKVLRSFGVPFGDPSLSSPAGPSEASVGPLVVAPVPWGRWAAPTTSPSWWRSCFAMAETTLFSRRVQAHRPLGLGEA